MGVRRLESEADVAAVKEFLAGLEAESGVPPLGESKFVDLGGARAGTGFLIETDELVAYLHLLWHESSGLWEIELAAGEGALDSAQTAAIVAAAAEEAAGEMRWWTFGDTGGAAFAATVFPTARTLHKLRGSLPPAEPAAIPEGLRVSAFRPGRDEEAWLEANNAAFRGHPENGGWDRAELAERQTREWFEAEGFRLAWAGARVAGFCWTKRHSADLGEIYIIGVHPDFQGKGIGRAIVIEAMWYLAGVGCDTGMLYVDTTNRSALELYQSLGFEVERVDRCFAIPKAWPHEAH
ncbi:MAG: mycothiol synthase [Acidimicrobiia bacterium]|nr:mycothiol synthase [Acidimicrobiia bacterium]